VRRDWERADCDRRGKGGLDANGKLPLEDGERLIETGLLKLSRTRKHDFVDAHADRRIDRQRGGISDESRGMFDCVCTPSGSATFNASRTGPPACAADDSTRDVIAAWGRRACA